MNIVQSILEFLGSANVQKAIGVLGGPALAASPDGLPTWVKGCLAVVGPIFALGVHFVDAYRAKGVAGLVDNGALRNDVTTVAKALEQDIPDVHQAMLLISQKVAEVNAKVPDLTAIEPLVRSVVASYFTPPAPAGPIQPPSAPTMAS